MSSNILTHIRNYTSAGLLAAVGGILSFPILTRNLSVEDYGLLGLVTSSIAVAVALGKLGIQHSIIRFFAQLDNNNNPRWSVKELYSTALIAMLLLSALLSVIWLITGTVILPRYMSSEKIPQLFFLATGVVFLRLLGSGIINFLRAQQASKVVSVSQVLHKYLHLGLIILALLSGNLSAAVVIVFLLVAELAMVVYVGKALWPRLSMDRRSFSPALLKSLVIFGLPLMAYESLSLVLRLSDRYVIEALLDVNALGQYSASYNLTSYLDMIIISGMVQAIRPMYTHIWESESKLSTQNFLERGFRLYTIIGIPLILAFSLVAPDLLILLSGEKYHAGTVIIPYVALSFFLEGAVLFLGAGLHIGKNTSVFLQWALLAAVLNIGLNILLVPYFGLVGAALMTIFSYLVFLAGVTRQSFKTLDFPVDLSRIFLIPLLAFLAYLFLSRIDMDNRLLSMLFKGSLATMIYASLLFLLDVDIRDYIGQRIRKLRSGDAV
ncbi:MAG: oligosaccharide flippase family protein [Gammaproteobacteria bacterium]|nr:oligosaccharide flippase family protein [Gammaproteobacteria bacterium]